jgi:hypothetical protein
LSAHIIYAFMAFQAAEVVVLVAPAYFIAEHAARR